MAGLSFRPVDRVPMDFGGMRSTGISGFAYAGLRAALGLPPRLPRMYDTGQMLALPELDVLDALDCDVVHVTLSAHTNAFDEPDRWTPYDFDGRLPALVQNPGAYRTVAGGTIVQRMGSVDSFMPSGAFVFDQEHAGEKLDLESELREPDWGALSRGYQAGLYTDGRIREVREYLRRVRSATDRAVFLNGLQAPLGFPGGMAEYSMVCLLHPEWARERHQLAADFVVRQVELLLPEVRESIDTIMFAADDQGTQNGLILPPAVFRELYVPFYRKMTDAVHRVAPGVKVFLHSCGAIYDLIPAIIDAGFDVMNPVQWCAGPRSYREWKEACRGKLGLWGGGVNTQRTLPLGSVADVEREVAEVVPVMASGGGYVFCAIHNVLAEIDPRKVVAMYRTARKARLR